MPASRRSHSSVGSQFLSFAAVGAIGFLVDVGVLYLSLAAGLGLYLARAISFLSAATFTWFCNRLFTFPRQASKVGREWARFIVANALGGAVNYGLYAVLVAHGGAFASHPVLAVACGALAGLAFNFTSSKLFVFRGRPSP